MAGRGSKSKKRSAASFARARREQFVFFLDQCLGGKRVAEALRSAGAAVELLSEHFPQDVPDDAWLAEVGRRGWIVLTKDKRIRSRATELAALLRSPSPAFVLTGGNLRGEKMAQAFKAALPRMRQFVRDFEPPFVATVSAAGAVSMFLRRTDLPHRAAGDEPPPR